MYSNRWGREALAAQSDTPSVDRMGLDQNHFILFHRGIPLCQDSPIYQLYRGLLAIPYIGLWLYNLTPGRLDLLFMAFG